MEHGYITDREGNKYDTIHHNGYAIMIENLKTKTFANGDPVKLVKDKKEWLSVSWVSPEPAYCYFNNKKSTAKDFGLLYNSAAAKDPRQLLPDGWKLPSKDDWLAIASDWKKDRKQNVDVYTFELGFIDDELEDEIKLRDKKGIKYSDKIILYKKFNFNGLGWRLETTLGYVDASQPKGNLYFNMMGKYYLKVEDYNIQIENNYDQMRGAYIRAIKKL